MDSPITHEKIIEVLRPFAEIAAYDIGTSEGDLDLFRPIRNPRFAYARLLTVGDLRAARDLYQRLQAEKEGGEISETITAAAVQQEDGSVVSLPPPARHGDVLRQMHDLGGLPGSEKEQGFVTSSGRFVDRYEAYRIAVRADQIIRAGDFQPQLYSEDLW